jgi:hypothetical protein
MALLIFAAALEEVDDFVVDFAPGCSRLEEFLTCTVQLGQLQPSMGGVA